MTQCVSRSSLAETLISLLNAAVSFKKKGEVSTIVHKMFDKIEVGVSMVELLSLLKTEGNVLEICETNHHFVNSTTEEFLELQKWFTQCVEDPATNKTLDMGIECVLFQKKKSDDSDHSIPFMDATGKQ